MRNILCSSEIPLIGIAASGSGAGKTQLILALLEELTKYGLNAAVLKHAQHMSWPIDKDSGLYMLHGAKSALAVSPMGWQFNASPTPEPDFSTALRLLEQNPPIDIILVEGYKKGPQPKLLLSSYNIGKEHLLPHTVALVSEAPQQLPLPCFDNTDTAAITTFIINYCGLGGK